MISRLLFASNPVATNLESDSLSAVKLLAWATVSLEGLSGGGEDMLPHSLTWLLPGLSQSTSRSFTMATFPRASDTNENKKRAPWK